MTDFDHLQIKIPNRSRQETLQNNNLKSYSEPVNDTILQN